MEKPKIALDRMEGDVAVLQGDGWFETQAAEEIKDLFSELVEKKGVKKVVLDLSRVDYINSAAIGSLIRYGNLLRDGGGKLVFAGVKRNLLRVFDLVGLGKVASRAETLEEALAQAKR